MIEMPIDQPDLSFLERLQEHTILTDGAMGTARTILADGAMGTMLASASGDWVVPEQLNVLQPEQVAAVHAAYIAAGSELVLTNTFGGSPAKLGLVGLGGEARALNLAAAVIARKVADQSTVGRVFVGGSIGPTGQILEPLGSFSVATAEKDFTLQAEALAEGKVDVIVVETMSDLSEARAAVRAALRVTNLPVVCSMSFDANLRTMMGVRPEDLLQLLDEGVYVVGANCGQGPDGLAVVLARLRDLAPTARLIAKPNAGAPRLADGQAVYDASPSQLADFARKMQELGVAIVGACCGSTPAHIAAMAAALRQDR